MSSASSPPPVGQEHRDGEDARDWSEDRDDDDDDWIDGAVLARDEAEEILQVAHISKYSCYYNIASLNSPTIEPIGA